MVRKAITKEKRYEIMTLKTFNNHSNRKIAAMVGVSEKCVRTTLANFEETNSAKEKAKPGRPHIFRQARANFKWSNADLARDYNNNKKNISVGRETVRRILKRKGIGSYNVANVRIGQLKNGQQFY